MTPSPLAPARFPELPVIDGVRFATAAAGVRYQGRDDVMLALLAPGSAVAGVFTRSATRAAPVLDCQNKIGLPADGGAAIVVNSGNANAFTGREGVVATEAITAAVADTLGLDPKRVFSSSTGVIGELLTYDRIVGCLPDLKHRLDPGAIKSAAAAIMTTDTFAKGACAEIEIDGKTVRIAGIAKGSGMISPDMATMLAYIFTDADLKPRLLKELLVQINEKSFNSITVDSDMSTNDMVCFFSTKKILNSVNRVNDKSLQTFKKDLQWLAIELAKKIIYDGEGATKLIEVYVYGATNYLDAKNVALSIANSLLVKTAIAGEDANWGRIIMAIGKSKAKLDQSKISLKLGKNLIINKGKLKKKYNEEIISKYLKKNEILIEANLNYGKYSSRVWTCDLTKKYIEINADYRS